MAQDRPLHGLHQVNFEEAGGVWGPRSRVFVCLRELKEQLKYSAEFQENENAWQEKHNMMLNIGSSKRGGGPERRKLGERNKRAEGEREKNQKETDLRDGK